LALLESNQSAIGFTTKNEALSYFRAFCYHSL